MCGWLLELSGIIICNLPRHLWLHIEVFFALGMGRTWQISGRICLTCGKNLSSGHTAKCDPSFQVGKNFENREKHQRRRIAWVRQADFGKLELNNRNHGGKCQHLSAKRDQFETRSI